MVLKRLPRSSGFLGEAVLRHRFREQRGEGRLHLVQVDAVLRPLRAGERGHHDRQVEFQRLAVVDVARFRDAEQALRLEVGSEGIDLLLGASGAA